jgi:hypothetical protein
MSTSEVTSSSTFRMEIAEVLNIKAPAVRKIAIMTHASTFLLWSTTVNSLEGHIKKYKKLKHDRNPSPTETIIHFAAQITLMLMLWGKVDIDQTYHV